MRTELRNIAIDADISETEINFDFERARFRNFQAIIARLTGSGIVDFSKYALWEFGAVQENGRISGFSSPCISYLVATC